MMCNYVYTYISRSIVKNKNALIQNFESGFYSSILLVIFSGVEVGVKRKNFIV